MKIFKKILDILITLILILLLGFAFISGDNGTTIGGVKALNVLTGSMEPTIKKGSLVFVKETPLKDFVVSDIVCYRPNDGTSKVTHRVVEINENNELITQGDANNAKDPGTVSEKELVGKVIFQISYIGSILFFLKKNIIITIIIACTLLFLPEIISKIFKKDEQ